MRGMKLNRLVLACMVPHLAAQMTIRQAVARAEERYPLIRAASEQANAAAAGINLARTAYLPKVDFHAQLNRATRNNIYGMMFPQGVIPPISGPPNPVNSMTNVWGSGAGFLVSWEPFDFGLRQAQTDAAERARRRAELAVERTRFEIAAQAADAFLTVLAAQQTVEAAKAGVKRAQAFHEIVSALVKAELRPGADAARTRAEVAMAESQRIDAERAAVVARASLAHFTGTAPPELDPQPGRLLSDPPVPGQTSGAGTHPALTEQAAAIEEAKARQRILERSYFPKFQLQGAQYARGSGANPDFTTGGAAAGLGPNIYNWGVGFSLTMPLMDYASLREKKKIESIQQRVEAARLDQIKAEIDTRLEKAKAMLEGAQRLVANIPIQIESARAAETQATVRYRSGLGTLAEVAEAQRLLTQTEIDQSLARLAVWRALLAIAAAQGDLKPFLDEAER